MTEFERGVRYAMESLEHYTLGTADDPRQQFGEYVMERRPQPPDLSEKSAAHLERRIIATLACAAREKP